MEKTQRQHALPLFCVFPRDLFTPSRRVDGIVRRWRRVDAHAHLNGSLLRHQGGANERREFQHSSVSHYDSSRPFVLDV